MNIRKIAGTSAVILAAATVLACGSGDFDDPTKKDGQAGSSTTSGGTTVTTSKAPKGKTYAPLGPADIKLTVKVLSRQCFGSAGCNVEFRISGLTFSKELDPEAEYEVTYTYKGLEDPVESRLTLQGADGKYEVEETEYGQTKRKSDKITAVVTSVEKM